MRRAVIAASIALFVALMPSPAGAQSVVVVHPDDVEIDYSGPVPYCGFPLLTTLHEVHSFAYRFAGLPEGVDPLSGLGFLFQVEGKHFVDLRETVTNPANGRSVELTQSTRLIARDIDNSDITLGPNGEWNGYGTATYHLSGSFHARASGKEGPLVIAGHQVSKVTILFENDIRVARDDTMLSTAGQNRGDLCALLV